VTPSVLAGWDNFLVIAGSSAAGLTGLTFIVITLSAQFSRINATGLKIFITPTIVHFSTVLAFSAVLSMPHHTTLSISLIMATGGIAGLTYVATIAASIPSITSAYVPVHEDWIWNLILPAIGYATLLAAVALIWRSPHASLYVAAGVLVLLMLIGIHNAWDVAVWNSTHREASVSKDVNQ